MQNSSISAHLKSLPNVSRAAEELTRKKEFRSQDANTLNSEQISIKTALLLLSLHAVIV